MNGDDRAVSEVLGFVLVFGIVIGAVGLMAFTGFDAMIDYQEGEQLRNAERGMVALADNFNDVLRSDGIDERSGELALREGTVTIGNGGAAINVTVDGDSVFDDSDNVSLGSFEYSVDGREDTIAYEGGGVFRGDSSGNVSIADPQIACNRSGGEAAVVSLVAIDTDERSLMSSNVKEFTAIERRYETRQTYTDVDRVNVTFDEPSAYQNGWNGSLTSNGWDVGEGDDQYTCEADHVVVRVVVIDVEY